MKPKKMKIADLVLDFDLYPRPTVDTTHVNSLFQALESGAEFPPIVACAKTHRVVDGFHRVKCYKRAEVDECLVLLKTYASDAELLADAIRANAAHGRRLTPFDRSRCLLLAERYGLSDDDVADALQLSVDRIRELRVSTFASCGKEPIALKRTIKFMAGKKLTTRQCDANRKLGGMNAAFYVNQIIELLESGLIDHSNDVLMARLAKLRTLLDDDTNIAAATG